MNEQEEARWLAEKVMGWTVRDSKRLYYYEPAMLITEWRPDMKIAQAMMVVEALRQKQYFLSLSENAFAQTKPWAAEFLSIRDVNAVIWGVGDTPAAAICAAVIKTVETDTGHKIPVST